MTGRRNWNHARRLAACLAVSVGVYAGLLGIASVVMR